MLLAQISNWSHVLLPRVLRGLVREKAMVPAHTKEQDAPLSERAFSQVVADAPSSERAFTEECGGRAFACKKVLNAARAGKGGKDAMPRGHRVIVYSEGPSACSR